MGEISIFYIDGKVFHFLPDLLITASAFNKIEFDKQRRLLTLGTTQKNLAIFKISFL